MAEESIKVELTEEQLKKEYKLFQVFKDVDGTVVRRTWIHKKTGELYEETDIPHEETPVEKGGEE